MEMTANVKLKEPGEEKGTFGRFCSLHLPDGTQHKDKGWESQFATREFLSSEKDFFFFICYLLYCEDT